MDDIESGEQIDAVLGAAVADDRETPSLGLFGPATVPVATTIPHHRRVRRLLLRPFENRKTRGYGS
jgi:hypothetical protein